MAKFVSFVPGVLIAAGVALLAQVLSEMIPGGLVSAAVFAMLVGMALQPLVRRAPRVGPGLKLSAKRGLRLAIVLLGATLSLSQVFAVGRFSLCVMAFTLVAAFGGGYLIGKAMGLPWRLSSLISAGTGICGGSAIAAIAPTIEARDEDVALAIAATFLFDVLMVLLFPVMGRALHMSDIGFGLWAGTAVNDTSSVVAAGYAFSDAAGAFAVIVKLTRTLSILPVVLIFAAIQRRSERRAAARGAETVAASGATAGTAARPIAWKGIVPTFIVLFLAMVVLRSVGIVPASWGDAIGRVSKFLMAMALAAIGMGTDARAMMRAGVKPMLHGLIISALVVVVAYAAQALLGQV